MKRFLEESFLVTMGVLMVALPLIAVVTLCVLGWNELVERFGW